MLRSTLSRRAWIPLLLGLCAWPATPHAGKTVEVRVLLSQESRQYGEVVDGFLASLSQAGISVTSSSDVMGDDPSESLSAERPEADLILSLGTRATHAAIDHFPDTPIVTALVLDASEIERGANATGVLMDFPVAIQLRAMRRVLPKGNDVGVLFDPDKSSARIQAAVAVADEIGLKLVQSEVAGPKNLPSALKTLSRRADVIWGIADPTVFSKKTARQLLVFSFRNRIPMSGLSSSWVKAGALYSLERDFSDVGAQCGELAIKILGGASPKSFPPQTPRAIRFVLNQKTAKHMKVEFSEDLLREASQVFE